MCKSRCAMAAWLYADVFRPDTTEKVPVIMNLSVYQKDKLWIPPADLKKKRIRI
jgi:hypothetical protein